MLVLPILLCLAARTLVEGAAAGGAAAGSGSFASSAAQSGENTLEDPRYESDLLQAIAAAESNENSGATSGHYGAEDTLRKRDTSSGALAGGGANSGSGAGSNANSGSGAGSNANSGSGAGSNANSGSGAGSNANSGSGAGSNANSGSGAGSNANSGSGAGSNANSGSGAGSNANSGSGAGSNANSGSGAERSSAGSNANSGSSAGSNANSGSSAGSNANSGSSASSCDSQSQWTDGLCPIISGVPLDMTKKAGYWYEVQRSANDFSGLDKCAKVFWRKPQNGVSYIINKSYSNVAHVTETTVSQMKKCGAKNYYTYHVPILGVVSRNQVYLDLDYDSHALFWTCENHGNKHRATFTLLSRHPNLPENIEEIEQKACAKFNLSMPPMVSFDLSGCNDAYDSYDFCENN
ncbi:Protein of unknown function [Cotesia congregata]|uniref:Uncharacterized protein n=1 Tax=Cotesia congregata TaxID=51543 RepID=A0A8J2E3H2_COTCN|nr:Protein of unknown function [Cotesia congregata]